MYGQLETLDNLVYLDQARSYLWQTRIPSCNHSNHGRNPQNHLASSERQSSHHHRCLDRNTRWISLLLFGRWIFLMGRDHFVDMGMRLRERDETRVEKSIVHLVPSGHNSTVHVQLTESGQVGTEYCPWPGIARNSDHTYLLHASTSK